MATSAEEPSAKRARVPEVAAPGSVAGLVSYVTDIEGDLEYWNRYVDLSRVLHRAPRGEVRLAEGAHFVFGGDAVDSQLGDLQVLEELVALKRRYPDRVHLIVGNRDNNKLRLPVELGQAHRDAVPFREHPGPYWAKHCRPAEKLSGEELENDSAGARLRWILSHTMGAPRAFELRREELSRSCGGGVDDDAVVDSFLGVVGAEGILVEYLRNARLAARVGSVLFVHAGLPRGSAGWSPGWVPAWEPGSSEKKGLPMDEWLAELERLSSGAMAQYAEAARAPPGPDAWSLVGGYAHPQPGSALMQYGMRDLPDGSNQPSVIYNGWLDSAYLPMQPDDATLAWLRAGGVRTVVSGHLPHGDAPLVLRVAGDVDAITADTSYAANVKWEDERPREDAPTPSRGARAVCEVLLGPGPGQGLVHGVLANGLAYEARLDDDLVGRSTADGWRVKGRVGQDLLLSRNTGWTFTNRLASPADVL